MTHLSRLSLGLASLACLTPSVAFAQSYTVNTTNTASAAPDVPRVSTTPCVVTLFSDVAFADFSPKPFAYEPPSGCPGPWAQVVLEADWSITAGNQYDRTASVWIGGANVYFGTTSEPSASTALSWHVERDLTDYTALFRGPQAGAADLGNLVNATYTSVLHGSARLLFYPALWSGPGPASPPADLVIPLSAGATGGTVALTAGGAPLSLTATLPRNVLRASLDVVAQSQADDEFWYTCVPDDVAGTLQSCGGTAFRETEVTLDGQPAGISPVYPWIFTGGIDPFLWAPIPGNQTLNFAPYRVELTPFAGLLANGAPHTVSLSVFNAADNFATTANLLVWLDPDAAVVTGGVTGNTLAAAPTPQVTENLTTAPDGSLSGTVGVTSSRTFTITGWTQGSQGRVTTAVSQTVGFSNVQTFLVTGTQYVQDIAQQTSVLATTKTTGTRGISSTTFSATWPLSVDISYLQAANGSATETTSIHQQLYQSVSSLSGKTGTFTEVEMETSPTDTLSFDVNGNFTGNSGQSSSQRYYSAGGTAACYSRLLSAAGGFLYSVDTGEGCSLYPL